MNNNKNIGTCVDCGRDTVDDDEYCSRCIVQWLDNENLDHDEYYGVLSDNQ